jgi:signal transduction histidine kinase
MTDDQKLAELAGARLRELADVLVARWIDWIRAEIHPESEMLSERALRDHLPPVVESLGDYLASPSMAVRTQMLEHLRQHARMRRDQGYVVQDLLGEFDGLAHLVGSTLQREVLARWADRPLDEVITVFGRLATGLRTIAFVTVGVFESSQDDRRQELAGKLSDFASTISHELRTPVQSARIGAALLLKDQIGGDPQARRQQAQMIQSAMNRIEHLLEDVDLLAMTEAAQMQPRMGPLPGLLEDIRQELSTRAEARGVRLDVDAEPPRVAVERVVAQLALVNVIGNAIKYADPEKADRWVRVRVALARMDDAPVARITVEDNGLGIPAEYHSRVFQRRVRAHPDAADGTGLGLTITRELILERGGTIELQSEEGQGTQVIVQLRAFDIDSGSASAAAQPEALIRQSVTTLLETKPDDLELDDDSTEVR